MEPAARRFSSRWEDFSVSGPNMQQQSPMLSSLRPIGDQPPSAVWLSCKKNNCAGEYTSCNQKGPCNNYQVCDHQLCSQLKCGVHGCPDFSCRVNRPGCDQSTPKEPKPSCPAEVGPHIRSMRGRSSWRVELSRQIQWPATLKPGTEL